MAALAALALAGLAGAAVFVVSGAYNVAATSQHLQPIHTLLEFTMRQSVRLRARSIAAPEPRDAAGGDTALTASAQRGAACYRVLCVQCHGAPGVAQNDIGKSMQPVPGPLVDAMQRWRTRELFWITRHGIKLSGMPAWSMRLSDAQIWDVVAFVELLPALSPQAYAAATRRADDLPVQLSASDKPEPQADCPQLEPTVAEQDRPDGGVLPADGQRDAIERGRIALSQYACTACHTIPGVTSSHPNVGPPLAGIASRAMIASRLPNTPVNLVRWLREPQVVKPLTAMPAMGMTEAHARDMAAYLGTLR